jgi:hypothetical protein
MSGSIPHLPKYTFMAWRSVKKKAQELPYLPTFNLHEQILVQYHTLNSCTRRSSPLLKRDGRSPLQWWHYASSGSGWTRRFPTMEGSCIRSCCRQTRGGPPVRGCSGTNNPSPLTTACYEKLQRASDLEEPVADSCEHGNEPSSIIESAEFLDQLNNCQLLKNGSTQQS